MGSSGSKGSSGASSRVRRGRSIGHRVFQSSCLSTLSGSCDSDNDDQVGNNRNKHIEANVTSTSHTDTLSDQIKIGGCRKVKDEQSVGIPYLSSSVGLDEWDQASVSGTVHRTGSSSARDSSTQSLNPSTHFLSRFSFIPGNVSFRLSRATSLGSSRSCPVPSTSLSVLNNEDDIHLQTGLARGSDSRDETRQGTIQHSPHLANGDADFRFKQSSGISENSLYDQTISSTHDLARDLDSTRLGTGTSLYSPRIQNEYEGTETRLSERRIGAREPNERNFRFSRTLSVGRLRDRVLRRSSLSDLTFCPVQQDREDRDGSQSGDMQAWNDVARDVSENNTVTSPATSGYTASSVSTSLFGIHDYEAETTRPRESRYHDLLEHRSNFLERRRRIRSQVRALQRLGSRFENLSGHERNANINDNTNTRASISRIVMLAEALFEVLDEIHQQSVVLSSRPSVSSNGSVPAPNEVVESLPVKLFSKLQKHQNDEVTLCYICLVEYEEGDSVRTLPCHHEFHRACVDKWLKEIHRVCPLCRGDICRSNALIAEN